MNRNKCGTAFDADQQPARFLGISLVLVEFLIHISVFIQLGRLLPFLLFSDQIWLANFIPLERHTRLHCAHVHHHNVNNIIIVIINI